MFGFYLLQNKTLQVDTSPKAQYDKDFFILSVAKNPHLKYVNLHFKFVDTSLCYANQYDKQTLLSWLAFCRSALARALSLRSAWLLPRRFVILSLLQKGEKSIL